MWLDDLNRQFFAGAVVAASTAEMRDNHISNLLSIRADVGADDKVRAIEAAPSDDLAGRALIEMRAE